MALHSGGYAQGAARVRASNATIDASSRRARKSVQALRSTLSQVGTVLKGLGVLSAAQAGRLATEFDDALTQVVTLVGVAREQVQGWRSDLIAMGPEVGRGPVELAKSLFVVTSAGERGGEALRIVEQAGRAAAVGLGETADIARAVTAAIQAYGSENLNASQATDILVATVREGNLEASELAGVLGRVLGIAAQVGVTFGEVGGFIATFTRLGVDSAEAVTALRALLNTLIKPSKQAKEALAQVGISIQDLRASIEDQGLAETLINLLQTFEGNDEALARVIPNVRALAGILGTAGSQAKAFLEIEKNVVNSTGILADAFAGVADSPGHAFRQLRAQVEVLAIAFGDGLARAVAAVLGPIQDLEERQRALADLGSQLGEILAYVAEVLGFLARHFELVKNAALGFLGLKFLLFFAGLRTAVVMAIKDQLGLAGASQAAAAATSRLGVTVQATSLLVDQYGRAITRSTAATTAHSAATARATATTKTFSAAGIAALTVALGVLAIALLQVNDLVSQWKRELDLAMETAVAATAAFSDRLAALAREASVAVSTKDLEQLNRVLSKHWTELQRVTEAREEAAKKVADLRQKEAELQKQYDEAAKRSAKSEFGDTAALQELGQALSEVSEKLKEEEVRFNEANREAGLLEKTTDQLIFAKHGLTEQTEELNNALKVIPLTVEQIRARLEQLRRQIDIWTAIRDETENIIALMGAWSTRNQGIASEWAIINKAIALGISPARELDATTREYITTLLRVESHWEAIQNSIRDTRKASLDFLASLEQLGIRLGRLAQEALEFQRNATLNDLDQLLQTQDFQDLLVRLDIDADDLRRQIEGAFAKESFKLEVDLLLKRDEISGELETDSFQQRMDDFSEWLSTAFLEEGFWGRMNEALVEHGDQWVALGDTVAGVLSGVDEELGALVQSLADVLNGMVQVATATNALDAIMAGAETGANIGSMFGTGQRGRGSFGGRLSGDYSEVGGAILGAVGSYFGPLGTLIGGAIGGLLGSAIKTGADDGFAQLRSEIEGIDVSIFTDEGGMGQIAGNIASNIQAGLEGLEGLLGIEFGHLGQGIGIKIRDDIITVMVNGIRTEFEAEDMEAAIEFALLEALKQIDVKGASENVLKALRSRNIGSAEQLAQVLDFAHVLDDVAAKAGPLAGVWRETNAAIAESIQLQREHGFAMSEVVALNHQRVAALRDEAESIRTSVFGITDWAGRVLEVTSAVSDFNRGLDTYKEKQLEQIVSLEVQAERLREQIGEQQNLSEAMGESSGEFDLLTGGLGRLGQSTRSANSELVRAEEELNALRDALGDIPEAIDEQALVDAIAAISSEAGRSLIAMLQQVHGEQFLAAEDQMLQQQLFALQLAVNIQAVETLLATTELLDQATRNVLASILDAANETLAGIVNGNIQVSGRRRVSRGGGGRNISQSQIDDDIRRVEDLRLLAAGVSQAVLDLVRGFQDFNDWAEEARRRGLDAADIAQAARDNLQVLTDNFLQPFLDIIANADAPEFASGFNGLAAEFEAALQQAYGIAAETARQNGTDIATEFQHLRDTIQEAFSIQAEGMIEGLVEQLSEAGDIEGLQQLLGWLDEYLASLPEDLRLALGDLPDAWRDMIEEAITATEEAVRQAKIDELDLEIDGLRSTLTSVGEFADRLAALDEQFSSLRERTNELYEGTAELADRLAELDDLALLAGQALGLDFLKELESAGVALPELANAMQQLYQASLLAQLALLATNEGFVALLEGMGLSVEELARRIVEAFEQTEETPPGDGDPPSPDDENQNQDTARKTFAELFDEIFSSVNRVATLTRQIRDFQDGIQELREGALETGMSVAELIERLREIDKLEAQGGRALGLDFLASLRQVGLEVPGLAAQMLELERAMALAQLAALATNQGFLQLLSDLGLTLEGLASDINAAFDRALEDLEVNVDVNVQQNAPRPVLVQDGLTEEAKRFLQVQQEITDFLSQVTSANLNPLQQLNESFRSMMDRIHEIGNAVLEDQLIDQLAEGYGDAVRAVLDGMFEPVEDRLKELQTGLGNNSPLTQQQQLDSAMAEYQALLQQVLGGDVDALDELLSAQEAVEDLMANGLGTSSAGFAEFWLQMQEDLEQVLAIREQLAEEASFEDLLAQDPTAALSDMADATGLLESRSNAAAISLYELSDAMQELRGSANGNQATTSQLAVLERIDAKLDLLVANEDVSAIKGHVRDLKDDVGEALDGLSFSKEIA